MHLKEDPATVIRSNGKEPDLNSPEEKFGPSVCRSVDRVAR